MAATRKKLTPSRTADGKKPKPKSTPPKTNKANKKTAAKKTVASKPATKKAVAKTPLKKKAAVKKAAPRKSATKTSVSRKTATPIQKPVAASSRTKPRTRGAPPLPSPDHMEPGALEVAHKAAAILFSKKAEDVVLLDLRSLSTVADYYLICTCQNEPQMRAILSSLQRALSREGIKSLRSEYMPGVRWAVMDYSDLIIHLFEKQTRGYYSLERLWADAPAQQLKAGDYTLPEEAEASEDDEL